MELSHSSANLLQTCTQKFYYYKTGVKPDKDSEEDMTALNIGSAVHYLLEKALDNHKYNPKKVKDNLKFVKKEYNLGLNWPLVYAMVLKYISYHKKLKVNLIALELPVQNNNIIGYIDVIEGNDHGWSIVDLKTTSYISIPDLIVKTRMDPQLHIYASFIEDLATGLELDIKRFQGCHYRVISKPKLSQRVSETNSEYVRRLLPNIRVEDIFVEHSPKMIAEVLEKHFRLKRLGEDILSGKIQPMKNTTSCFNYFKPCPYISQCLGGKTYTETVNEYHLKHGKK